MLLLQFDLFSFIRTNLTTNSSYVFFHHNSPSFTHTFQQWLGKSGRSKDRILRICSKTNAQDVCTGTCRSGNDRCVFSS